VTPLPGIAVIVEESDGLTPIATYESFTGNDGRLIDEIEVDSSAFLFVYSGSRNLAKFARVGNAVEFSEVYKAPIIATPMAESAGACLTLQDSTPVAVLRYNTLVDSELPIEVSVSQLDPEMYRDPSTDDDDLEINSLRDSAGVYQTIPNRYLTNEGSGVKQIFDETGEFSIPYDVATGLPLVWRFLGSETLVDDTTPLCDGGGILACERFSEEDILALQALARDSLSRYTKEMWKTMRRRGYKDTKKYLKKVIRFYKKTLAASNKLYGTYICTDINELENACEEQKVRKARYISWLTELFDHVPKGGEKRFGKAKKALVKRYRELFQSRFPDTVWRCDSS
jgi:hypothetical protein